MEIEKGRIYRHFKGNDYLVEDIAINNENDEKYVVYRALYGDHQLYVRQLSDFLSPVDTLKYPSCTQKYKFELQPKSYKSEEIK